MQTLIIVVHVIVALFLILVVLLQSGKGAAMGAVFGSGSQTMFGGSSGGNILTKLTAGAAVVFMITSLSLATLSVGKSKESVVDDAEGTSTSIPVAPDPKKEESSNK